MCSGALCFFDYKIGKPTFFCIQFNENNEFVAGWKIKTLNS